eukprot:gb/GECH01009987.1/.p1 GENE.gb/GECH01009987.1/~~gb/GECH01009987.1/.p1  ORF type:complete len:116 (+),score=42.99 gb/GECH01009987.1/:1-348(+)
MNRTSHHEQQQKQNENNNEEDSSPHLRHLAQQAKALSRCTLQQFYSDQEENSLIMDAHDHSEETNHKLKKTSSNGSDGSEKSEGSGSTSSGSSNELNAVDDADAVNVNDALFDDI